MPYPTLTQDLLAALLLSSLLVAAVVADAYARRRGALR